MLGTKYLSELVKPDMLAKDKLNIIKAPTGSGKTHFALTAIPALLHDALHKVVYLIDTIDYDMCSNFSCQFSLYKKRVAFYCNSSSLFHRKPLFHRCIYALNPAGDLQSAPTAAGTAGSSPLQPHRSARQPSAPCGRPVPLPR